MKTLEFVKNEIEDIIGVDISKVTTTAANRMRKRVQFLNACKLYLETSPTEDFILKEIARLENRVNLIQDGFTDLPEHYPNDKLYKQARAGYEKLMGLPQDKEHLKTLRFLRNN